jgi:hypothetical protein
MKKVWTDLGEGEAAGHDEQDVLLLDDSPNR